MFEDQNKLQNLYLPFRFYWKIIVDPETMSGVAVVGVNSPHIEVAN